MSKNHDSNKLLEAKEYYRSKQYDKCKKILTELLLSERYKGESYYFLGLIEYSERNHQKALNFFNTAININNTHSNSHYYIGKILLGNDDKNRAFEAFSRAISIQPTHAGARKELDKLMTSGFKKNESENIEFIDEFYYRLSNDKTPEGKRALGLVKELEFVMKPPLISFLGSILIPIPEYFLRRIFFGFFINFFIFLLSSIYFAMIAENIEDKINSHIFSLSLLTKYTIPITIIAIIFLTIFRTCLKLISAQNTSYEIRKGRIKKISGSLTLSIDIYEIFHITNINIKQDLFNQITGYASFSILSDQGRYDLVGIEKMEKALIIQDKLRETAYSLRRLPYFKVLETS